MNKSIGLGLFAALISVSSHATPLLFDENVTPDIIFGTGNSNGSFTVDRDNGVELGLRAKIPFVGTINSNGDGTYSYNTGEIWNFDWTINTDYDSLNNPSGLKLDDLTYFLGLDLDPTAASSFFAFDPVTPTASVPFYDHSIGDNTTGNGAGVEAIDNVTYVTLLANNNVLQQSWRYDFFTSIPGFTYDEAVPGIYDITLGAMNGGIVVAQTSIQVLVSVPEPATYLLLSLGLFGIVIRKNKARKG